MARSTIKYGSRGSDVSYAQSRLVRHGHSVDIDGIFGSGTKAAVMQFQASRNLSADGIVGKNTWAALDDEGEGTDDTQTEKPQSEKDKLLALIPEGIGRRESVLMSAIGDLGKSEAGNTNFSEEIAHLVDGYNKYWGIADSSYYPWCAMACSSWVGIGLGKGSESKSMDWASTPMKKFLGGASQYEEWGHDVGIWTEETEEAPAGAVFCMARGGSGSDPSQTAKAGHVGMVICDNGDGTITTIEGNTSNSVKSYVRHKSDLHGFVSWWLVE